MTATQTPNRSQVSFTARLSAKSAVTRSAPASTKKPSRSFLDIVLKALSAFTA